MRGSTLALGLLAGCYHPSPPGGAPCNSNHECPDGLACTAQNVCSTGATMVDAAAADAMVDACPTAACAGNQLVGCGPPVTCSSGCLTTSAPHCGVLVPSNGVSTTSLAGATAEVTGNKYDFNTDTGAIKQTSVTIRAAGMGVISGIDFHIVDGNAVFTANRFAVPANQTWTVSGDTHPIVLFAATTISVTGALTVGAGSAGDPGPGGTVGRDGSQAASACDGSDGVEHAVGFGDGGGGGGGATPGGDGATVAPPDVRGGSICIARPTTIPLRGGTGGGAAGVGGGTFVGGHGGGGGGAIQLVAMESIAINTGGAVAAPGGGGESLNTTADGGGGGGGGGAVLLEAPVVTITGSLTANGGGGGAPSGANDGSGGSVHTTNPAAGGTFMTGAGGTGGTGTANPTDGTFFSDATPSARGGGGGGAVGRLEIKSLMSTVTGVTSPAPVKTMAVVQ